MMTELASLRPGDFSRQLLRALDASEGRRRRRKRDQTPDGVGLGIKRDLLDAAIVEDPEPADFEGWLLMKALAAPASGPVLALCSQIMDEYRVASADPSFGRWLADGAPSADTESPPADGAGAPGTTRETGGRTPMRHVAGLDETPTDPVH
jgi:hypothetical protein